jgi:hypothetical protein
MSDFSHIILFVLNMLHRLKKSEEEIERIVWRIKYEDLVFYKRSQLGISRSTLIVRIIFAVIAIIRFM